MTQTDWIGSIGVTILLIAFLLNLADKIKKESLSYLLMNVLGAGTACFASILLNYLPFIILEGSWTLVSGVGLVSYLKKYKDDRGKELGKSNEHLQHKRRN
jgi:hypothetical protein